MAGDPEGATPITWSLPTGGVNPNGGCIAFDPDGADGDLTSAEAMDSCLFKISQSGRARNQEFARLR